VHVLFQIVFPSTDEEKIPPFASSQKYLDGRRVEYWLASSHTSWQVLLFVTAREMARNDR
jgi:hypothetical protein